MGVPGRIVVSDSLDEGVDLALLEAGVVEIEGEFHREHQDEDEEAEEGGGSELGLPDAVKDAGNHYERADGGKRAEEKNAGGAAEINRRNKTKGEV